MKLQFSTAQRVGNGLMICFGIPGAYLAILLLLRYGIGFTQIPDWMLLSGLFLLACYLVRGIVRGRRDSWFSVYFLVDTTGIEQRLPSGEIKRAEWAALESVSSQHGSLSTLWGYIWFGLTDMTGFGKPIILLFSEDIQIEIPRIGIPRIAYDTFVTPMVEISGKETPLYRDMYEYAQLARAQEQVNPTRGCIYLLIVPVVMIMLSIRTLFIGTERRVEQIVVIALASIFIVFVFLLSRLNKK